MRGSDGDGPDLPIVSRATVEDAPAGDRHKAQIAGVLLAAGTSSRFGDTNKLLTDLHGEPVVRHSARTLLHPHAGLDRVVAVVGHEADQVRTALSDEIAVVLNPGYQRGQATSVRAGVKAVRDSDAAVFALGDLPRVQPETVGLLTRAFWAGLGDPIAAACDGRRGNPVLFGARHFDALANVEGDTGGRRILLESEDATLVETDDPGILEDVDTPEDLERLR